MPKTGIFFKKKEGQKMQLSDAAGGGSETGNWMKELDFLSMGIGGLNKEFEVNFVFSVKICEFRCYYD